MTIVVSDTTTTPAPAPAEDTPPPHPAQELIDNGCPVCAADYHGGPESDAWQGPHCWQCGFRSGQGISGAVVSPATPVNLAGIVDQLRSELMAGISDDLKALLASSGQGASVSIGGQPVGEQAGGPSATATPPATVPPATPTAPPPSGPPSGGTVS